MSGQIGEVIGARASEEKDQGTGDKKYSTNQCHFEASFAEKNPEPEETNWFDQQAQAVEDTSPQAALPFDQIDQEEQKKNVEKRLKLPNSNFEILRSIRQQDKNCQADILPVAKTPEEVSRSHQRDDQLKNHPGEKCLIRGQQEKYGTHRQRKQRMVDIVVDDISCGVDRAIKQFLADQTAMVPESISAVGNLVEVHPLTAVLDGVARKQAIPPTSMKC